MRDDDMRELERMPACLFFETFEGGTGFFSKKGPIFQAKGPDVGRSHAFPNVRSNLSWRRRNFFCLNFCGVGLPTGRPVPCPPLALTPTGSPFLRSLRPSQKGNIQTSLNSGGIQEGGQAFPPTAVFRRVKCTEKIPSFHLMLVCDAEPRRSGGSEVPGQDSLSSGSV